MNTQLQINIVLPIQAQISYIYLSLHKSFTITICLKEINYLPILLGLIAGCSVTIGSMIVAMKKLSKVTKGYLGSLTGGILAYLALDTGAEAEEN